MKRIFHLAGLLAVASLCLWLIHPVPVLAAEFQGGDVYILPADAVVEEDLFVAGREIIIEGTVKGDLFAAGSSILIQGEVLGTAYLAAYVVALQSDASGARGIVHGDLMSASYNLVLDGTVGQDVRSAAGGTGDPNMAFTPGPAAAESTSFTESLPQGLYLTPRAQVGGDILAATSKATIEGTVGSDLSIATEQFLQTPSGIIGGDLEIASSHADIQGAVKGDLDVNTESIVFAPNVTIGGETRYTAPQEAATAPAGAIFTSPAESPDNAVSQNRWQDWLIRTVLILVGFGLLLVLARWAARFGMPQGADITERRLGTSLVWGVLSLFIVPMAIILVPAVTGLFLGIGNAIVVAGLFAAGWAAIWIFSPLIAGRSVGAWLGSQLPGEKPAFRDELLGVLLVVLVIRLSSLPSVGVSGLQGVINALGWIVLCLSYLLAVGSMVQGLGRGQAGRRPMNPDPESSRVPA